MSSTLPSCSPSNEENFSSIQQLSCSTTSCFQSRIPSYSKRTSNTTLITPNSNIITSFSSSSCRRTSIPFFQDSIDKLPLLSSGSQIEKIPHTDSVLFENSSSDSEHPLPTSGSNSTSKDIAVKEDENKEEEEEEEEEKVVENGVDDDDEDEVDPLTRTTEFASSGRIQVFVRVRPILSHDPAQREEFFLLENDTLIHLFEQSSSSSSIGFQFDHIFNDHQGDAIFRKVGKPLVKACLKGFNGTLIAYGQTGSGKTHTLFSDQGLLPLTLQSLYQRLLTNMTPYSVSISMIQIYQEKIYDLLGNDVELELREHPELGAYLERGTKVVALTYSECQSLVLEGYQHRIVKETLMNPTSSRSHVIVFFEITQTFGHVLTQSKLTFCDLAGSERIKKTNASGTILNEAKEINLSLLEMGNVIQSLANRKKHIPFRNSVLTRILQESLGGNCLTSLIICISPCKRDLSETKGSLQFGSRAMRIKTYAKVNEQVDHAQLAKELTSKLSNLESQLMQREVEIRKLVENMNLSQSEPFHELASRFSQLFPNLSSDSLQPIDWLRKIEELHYKVQEESMEYKSQSKVYDYLVKRLVKCTTVSVEEGSTTPAKLLASVEFLENKEQKEKSKSKSKLRCLIQ